MKYNFSLSFCLYKYFILYRFQVSFALFQYFMKYNFQLSFVLYIYLIWYRFQVSFALFWHFMKYIFNCHLHNIDISSCTGFKSQLVCYDISWKYRFWHVVLVFYWFLYLCEILWDFLSKVSVSKFSVSKVSLSKVSFRQKVLSNLIMKSCDYCIDQSECHIPQNLVRK